MTPQAFLAKQNRKLQAELVRSYQDNTCEVTSRGVVVHPDVFLSKQVWTMVAGRQNNAQVPGPIHFWEA